ncbi:VOC family protein [Ekhidna sp.]
MKKILIGIFLFSCIYLNAQSTFSSSTFSFPVSNLEASTEWYSDLLSNTNAISPAEGVVEFELNEKTWLQLFEGESSTNTAILRLEVNDIQSEHKRLKILGISPTNIELVPGVVSYFDFKDPDGNQLSFYTIETP